MNPSKIVRRRDDLHAGCQWVLDRWTELRGLLEDGLKWQARDRLKAIRLVMIYLACDAMEPEAPSSLDDMVTETDKAEMERIKQRVAGRDAKRRKPAGPEAGRASLLALIDEALARLNGKLAAHRAREFEEAIQTERLAFDDSKEGEQMRRHHLARARELYRAKAAFYKEHKKARLPRADEEAIVPTVEDASPIDANPCEPVGCAEPTPAPPASQQAVAGDKTNPTPAEDDDDKTNPTPAESPIPAAEEPAQPHLAAAVMAGLDPSDPRLPMILEDMRALERRRMS
jgi:hypothetical protein